MAENRTRSTPEKYQISFITLGHHQGMPANQSVDSKTKAPGVSARGVEKLKITSHGNSSFSRKENVSFSKKLDGSSFCCTRGNRSSCSNVRLKPRKQVEVVSENDPTVQRLHSVSEDREANRRQANLVELCVHSRPPKDTHYPFKAVRKNRTKMHSPVCVWCGVQKFMALARRPRLRTKTSCSDADWERWLIERGLNQSGILESLTGSLMPKSELLRYISDSQLGLFYKDFAGALIEMVLRELRKRVLVEPAIMAQVRSSKYHKAERLAQILYRTHEKPSSQRK